MNPLKITRGQYYVPKYSHVWPQRPRPPSALWLSAEKLCRCSNGTVGAGGAGRTGWEFADLLNSPIKQRFVLWGIASSIIKIGISLVVDKPMYKKFKSYKYIYTHTYSIYIHTYIQYIYIYIYYILIYIHTQTHTNAAVRPCGSIAQAARPRL